MDPLYLVMQRDFAAAVLLPHAAAAAAALQRQYAVVVLAACVEPLGIARQSAAVWRYPSTCKHWVAAGGNTLQWQSWQFAVAVGGTRLYAAALTKSNTAAMSGSQKCHVAACFFSSTTTTTLSTHFTLHCPPAILYFCRQDLSPPLKEPACKASMPLRPQPAPQGTHPQGLKIQAFTSSSFKLSVSDFKYPLPVLLGLLIVYVHTIHFSP
ncbi:hypothetical protein DFH08DRAFT_807146 [Mycena albidolilacea]|uniref:Uncharacterized protein n=1 Tax=Mycena albidolilacea TaxID=1033008 RepID=A0AAD7A5F5_9AGAR|nr:hypothetical protein DFH08DRAFT_807146 [Mycena albidolilacea]